MTINPHQLFFFVLKTVQNASQSKRMAYLGPVVLVEFFISGLPLVQLGRLALRIDLQNGKKMVKIHEKRNIYSRHRMTTLVHS